MAERITRPTVRLAGGLPDGNLSNLEQMGARLLSDAPPDVYALVWITRQKRVENDDQDGAETAIVKVRALEAFPPAYTRAAVATFPFDVHAGEPVVDVLQRLHADRTGEQALPLATSAEAAADDAAREALRQWADANLDEGRDGLAAVWNDYFGGRSPQGTVAAWRDAPRQMIVEFLAFKGEPRADLVTEADKEGEAYRAEIESDPDGEQETDEDVARIEAGGPGAVPAATFAGPGDHA